MTVARKLFKGATVGFVSTSAPVPDGRIDIVDRLVRESGLVPVFGESCFLRHGYLSGPDEVRAGDVNKMFADPKIDAVLCIRGGYGSQRLLPLLDYDLIRKNPKTFAGYSDITAFLTVFSQDCGFVTYHAPMYSTDLYNIKDKYTFKSFYDNLFEGRTADYANPPGYEITTLVGGRAEGVLTGGNLSLLVSSLKTPFEIDTKGKILFIEEVDEAPYRIDRMLLQLKYAGKFRDCSGIIFGSFKGCEAAEPSKSLTLNRVFEELIVPEGKPCISGFACGHSMPSLTLPMGAGFLLDSTAKVLKAL